MFRLSIFVFALLGTPVVAMAEDESGHARGDVSVEATAGLAAGYGLVGGSVLFAVSDRWDLGISSGVDLHNTHIGLRAHYYFMDGFLSPMAYGGVSRSRYQSDVSDYASAGGGIEYRTGFGLYLQGSGGFAAYLSGQNAEGNAPGFIEFRPLTVGFRF